MGIGVGVSVAKCPTFARMTEFNQFYARVIAGGGTISDAAYLKSAIIDYRKIASLNPSLYTFASGRKAGTQYSLIPTDGSGDFSVTRSGTTGMELNAQGYWQPVGENVPRYDYVSGVPMINIEEARTNLITRYKSFAHSDWTKSGASIQGDPNTKSVNKISGGDFEGGLIGSIALGTGQTATWTLNTDSPISGTKDGRLVVTVAGSQGGRPAINLNANRQAGELRRFSFKYKLNSGTCIFTSFAIGGSTININQTLSGSGVYTSPYFQTDGTGALFIYFNNTVFDLQIDDIDESVYTGYASPFVDSSGNNLMSGYKLVATSNNGYIRLATAATVTAATTYTNSIWIKRVTGTGQAYIIDTNTTDRAITLTTDWQRFTYSAAAGTTSGQIGVKLAVSGDEVLIAHAQLEAGATASSPIGGAEGSTQTRNADVIASAVDRSNIKTLVINNDAYVVETALPNNGYTLPQLDINKLAMFTNTLTDEQITANGWTKKVLAFAVSVNIAAGTTVSIGVNGVGTIEWGDGTSDSYSSLVTKIHTYINDYKGLILFTGTLTRFSTSSSANWYFNIKDIPANFSYLYITGSNTITGNIADAPADLTFLNIQGSNTITGNIADAPANLTYLIVVGSNTITGNIANAPADLTYLYIAGLNTLADYTAGRAWKTNYNYLYLRQAAGAGLSSTEVDNLLIDLAATTWGSSGRTLDIKGVNAARTSASDAAVLSLQAQSVTVLTN